MMLLALLGCDRAPADSAEPCLDCDSDSPADTDTATDSDSDTDTTTDTWTPPPGPPRVILFIGDGMGLEHIAGGGLYANGVAGSLVFEGFPNQGRLLTASLTGTTDSAAGATALSTGTKTWNDVVGMDRDIVALENVLEVARARGMSVGVVTTDTVTGATPASFYAHVDDRGNRIAISAQLQANPPDVTLGGGSGDLEGPPAVDVQSVDTREALLAATPDGRPLFGLFSESTFPFWADGYTTEPTLAEMTSVAISFLTEDPEGFFLMVEGARIDHASHGRDGDRVHQETAELDAAVAVALDWATAQEVEPTIVVTSDHECGGLEVSGGGTVGTPPDSEWRWNQHTNADIGVFGIGPYTDVFAGQRLDNTWVHAVMDAAVNQSRYVTAPDESLLVDGRTTDLGAVVVQQRWESSFGAGYNQLDALRVTADEDGLRIGVDGVYEEDANTTFVLLDIDYGGSTGLGADATALDDSTGVLDGVITAMPYTAGLDGLGFDFVFAATAGEELSLGDLSEDAGLRGIREPWAEEGDYWWLLAASNYDDGNLSGESPAPDAAAMGLTENGWEILLPWFAIYPAGLPPEGLTVALAVTLASTDGSYASNQALPPLSSADEPGASPTLIEAAVVLSVDGAGVSRGPAIVVP